MLYLLELELGLPFQNDLYCLKWNNCPQQLHRFDIVDQVCEQRCDESDGRFNECTGMFNKMVEALESKLSLVMKQEGNLYCTKSRPIRISH